MWSAFRNQNVQSEVYFSGKPEEGQGPPYFYSKLRPEKTFLERPIRPPPPYLRVWMTPPPSPSSEGLDSPLYLTRKFCCPVRFASILTNKLSPGWRLEGLQVLPDFTL